MTYVLYLFIFYSVFTKMYYRCSPCYTEHDSNMLNKKFSFYMIKLNELIDLFPEITYVRPTKPTIVGILYYSVYTYLV